MDLAGNVDSEMNWICLTTTESVWAAQYPALLDLAVGREHQPDVVLVALLGDHPDEQLPVLHGWNGEGHRATQDRAEELDFGLWCLGGECRQFSTFISLH